MDFILLIEVIDRVWRPGSRKIMDVSRMPVNFKYALLKHFTTYMAGVYVQELVKAINSQRYRGSWAPLTRRYLDHKKAMGWSTKIWEATSLLKNSIAYWMIDNGWAIGIDKKAVYTTETGMELQVKQVAQWMEYGTGEQAEGGKGTAGFPGMPARPLFRPLQKNLSSNIKNHFDNFTDEYAEEIDLLIASIVLGMEEEEVFG